MELQDISDTEKDTERRNEVCHGSESFVLETSQQGLESNQILIVIQ